MHAVVVKVTIGDFETARKGLREQVVPRASNAPGFVAGYWTRSDDGGDGLSMIVFESEDAARAAAEQIRSGAVVPETVTLESVEIREVAEHA
jgi:heme-degrading monooxygenase HmoA